MTDDKELTDSEHILKDLSFIMIHITKMKEEISKLQIQEMIQTDIKNLKMETIKRLKRELLEYGSHSLMCATNIHPTNRVCTCGWTEIFKELTEELNE